jgi:hypothetical protein
MNGVELPDGTLAYPSIRHLERNGELANRRTSVEPEPTEPAFPTR